MATNLIKIDDFKTYKGIKSQTDDSIISLLIASVSEFIHSYTDRTFIDYAYTSKVEYFDATEYHQYFLEEFPIIEVTELAVSTDGGVTYTVLTEDDDYFVDEANDMLVSNTGLTGFVSSTITHKSGRVTYTGGYVATPWDLRIAAMDLVEYYRKQEHTPAQSLQGTSVENPVVFLQGNQLPQHIKRVLDNYRRI